MRIGFLYYNCLGFGLFIWLHRHHTEYCIGSTEQTGSFHLVTESLVVLKRSAEVHSVVGLVLVPYTLRGTVKHFVVRLA